MKSIKERIKTQLELFNHIEKNDSAYALEWYINKKARYNNDINVWDSKENIAYAMAYKRYKKDWEKKKQRLYNRMYNMLEHGAYFITLTYKGETPNEKEAIKHMRKWSKLNCNLFISNIDYGDKNNRIHIHSVCVPKHVLHKTWKYGAINIKKIPNNKIQARKVVLYITKLVNHAIKGSSSHIYRSQRKELTNESYS